ncbi:MAG: PAS domain-containing protein [Anaerolineae bacterium]|nr:PAS domain-containing protein [Anaerolineae bacterium]
MSSDHELCLSILEALSHPFYVIDAESYVVKLANRAAHQGPLPEGVTCHALTHHHALPCDRLGETCPLKEIKRTRQPVVLEHAHDDAQGRRQVLEVHAFPVFDAQGEITEIIEYTLDITERKEAERLKDEFLSLVTHELRTPLHHIQGFASTLLQTDVTWDKADQRDFLLSIEREAGRLADLVDKILELARLEARLAPIERDAYPVSDLVHGGLQPLCDLLQECPVTLELEPALPPLWVDGRQIEMLLTNLIENAVKYSPEGSPIRIGARRQGDEVLLWVTDQGIGIAAEYHERIFERFFRVPVDGPRPPGTGLGLAICKRIVEAHAGRLWVESRPGRGSSFFVSLPIAGGPTGETP